MLFHDGAYYLYFNNWGTCPGVNCCDTPAGCATCCFDKPPHPYLPGCGDPANGSNPYGLYHTIQVYRTMDFIAFEDMGIALALTARLPGTEFRPHVVYCSKTDTFLMWYEDRGSNLHGYAVAQAKGEWSPMPRVLPSVGGMPGMPGGLPSAADMHNISLTSARLVHGMRGTPVCSLYSTSGPLSNNPLQRHYAWLWPHG